MPPKRIQLRLHEPRRQRRRARILEILQRRRECGDVRIGGDGGEDRPLQGGSCGGEMGRDGGVEEWVVVVVVEGWPGGGGGEVVLREEVGDGVGLDDAAIAPDAEDLGHGEGPGG